MVIQPSTLLASDGESHDVGDAGNRPTFATPRQIRGPFLSRNWRRRAGQAHRTAYGIQWTVAVHGGEGVAPALPLRRRRKFDGCMQWTVLLWLSVAFGRAAKHGVHLCVMPRFHHRPCCQGRWRGTLWRILSIHGRVPGRFEAPARCGRGTTRPYAPPGVARSPKEALRTPRQAWAFEPPEARVGPDTSVRSGCAVD